VTFVVEAAVTPGAVDDQWLGDLMIGQELGLGVFGLSRHARYFVIPATP